MKSNKIESLPPDLKKVADEMVANKFHETVVVEKTKKAGFRNATLKFAESVEKLKDAFGYSVEVGTLDFPSMHMRGGGGNIDPRLKDYIKQAEHMSNGMVARITVIFKPTGSFPRENYESIRNANETMELLMYSHSTIDHIKRVHYRLEELRMCYGGNFYAQMDRMDYEKDRYSSYPSIWEMP